MLWKIARYFFAERTATTLNDLFCLERQTLETRSKCHTFKRSPVWNKETQNTGIDLMNVSKWSIKLMAVASGVRSLKSAKGLSEILLFSTATSFFKLHQYSVQEGTFEYLTCKSTKFLKPILDSLGWGDLSIKACTSIIASHLTS